MPHIIITFIILFPLPPQSLTLVLLGHCNLCFIYVSWACIIIEKELLPITESISRKFFTRNKREIPTLFRKLQSLSRHDTCTYYLAFYVSPWLGPYFTFSLAFLGSNQAYRDAREISFYYFHDTKLCAKPKCVCNCPFILLGSCL